MLLAALCFVLGTGTASAASGRGFGGGFSHGPATRSFHGGWFNRGPHGHGGFAYVYPYPLYGYDPLYPAAPYTASCDPYSPYYNPEYCYDD